MAIGRLDEKSEGLLLLTTDGILSERVRSKKIEKEYYVLVDGEISDEAILQLSTGVEITVDKRPYRTRSCSCHRLDTVPNFTPPPYRIRDDRHGPSSWISITISEGKYRQLRKMTAAAGYPTLRLVRVRVGKILLGEMVAGDVRKIESSEIF